MVAQREKQFALAKKYKQQVQQSMERKGGKGNAGGKPRGVETQFTEQALSGDFHSMSPQANDPLINKDLAHMRIRGYVKA